MNEIEILHLSDLHLILSTNGNNLRKAVLEFAKKHFERLPQGQKLLILTGDFHNFGEDYHQAKEFLPELWECMGLDPRQDVFMVPGNHDIDDTSTKDLARRLMIQELRKLPDELNQEGELRNQYMEKLLSFYQTYLDFAQNMGIYSEEDCKNQIPVKTHVRTWRGNLRLLHLNTTLLADGTEKTNQMADTFSATSDEIQNQLQGGLPCIALGHNHIYDLHTTQWREGLRGAFGNGNVSAYLCGDRHQTDEEPRERTMALYTGDNDRKISIVCTPRGSSDEKDTSSQCGFILHTWNPSTGKVQWTVHLWKRTNPLDFKPDETFPYMMLNGANGARSREPEEPEKQDAAEVTQTLREQVKRWELDDAAEFLDAEIIDEKGKEFVELDADAFYRVIDSYNVMLRVLAAGKAIQRDKAVTDITECLKSRPVLIAGNGGMGKTTLMLMTAVQWARSGGVVVWLKLPRLGDKMNSGKARDCMATLSQWAQDGRRVLLCLDSPTWEWEVVQTLRLAWLHQSLWAGQKTAKGGCVQLLMAERNVRLRTHQEYLSNWFDGACVAELRRFDDTKRLFKLGNYQTIPIMEEERFRRQLLLKTTQSYIASGVLSRRNGQALNDKVDEVLKEYDKSHVNLVELIYRALLTQLQSITPKIIMDWQEWGRALRKQYGLSGNDVDLYGGIAAFSLFGCPLPISLFCNRFNLDKQDLISLLRNWRLSIKSGGIEPVIYTESDHAKQRKGDWGTLEPKHNIIAELFFLLRRDEDENYNESSIDRLMLGYLEIMSEPEIESLFRNMVNRPNMRQLKKDNIGYINYRAYMEFVYDRIQTEKLNLSEDGRLQLCLGLLWSDGGELISQWDDEIYTILKNIAPEADGHTLSSVFYTQWGKWLSKNRKGQEAEDKFRAVIAKDSEDIQALTELGKLLAKRKNDKAALKEAEELFRQIIRLDENDVPSRTELGKLLAKRWEDTKDKDALKEAETLFRDAMRINSKHLHSRTELGKLLASQHKDEEAEKLFREVIEKLDTDRKDLPARTELGMLLRRQGKNKEAEKLFREAMEINKSHIHSRHQLGLLLEDIGRKKNDTAKLREAKTLYLKILSIEPDHSGALRGLKRLEDIQTT